MSKSSQKADADRVKCHAPIEVFVDFAKKLAATSAAKRRKKLAEGPVAGLFAERLVREAFGGSSHAATCISLVGDFGRDADWADRLRTIDAAGDPPSPDRLQTKQLEPIGRGLLVISGKQAIPWIARAYLRLKNASAARTAMQTLLIDTAPTSHALTGALEDALGALESGGQRITQGIAAQCVDTLEKQAHRLAAPNPQAAQSPLARLATVASRAEMGRLVSALCLAQSGKAAASDADESDGGFGQTPVGGGNNAATKHAIAQAAWSEADEAIGRALQDMDLVDRSFERLESTAEGELADRARRAKGASDLVLQWVRQAARQRSVTVLDKVGDRVPFDPKKHELDGEAEIGELVRIIKPAIVRGSEPQQVVLVRGEAEID